MPLEPTNSLIKKFMETLRPSLNAEQNAAMDALYAQLLVDYSVILEPEHDSFVESYQNTLARVAALEAKIRGGQ